MGLRTVVSMKVGRAENEEARRALWSLATGPVGPVQVWRGDDPDAETTISVSLPGDVQAEVREQLAALTALDWTVDVTGR